MSDTERDDFVCIRCGAYLKNFAEIAELKAEIEPLRQWYADSHRIIDEWDTKCGALKARVEEYEQWFDKNASTIANHRIGGFSLVCDAANTISVKGKQ